VENFEGQVWVVLTVIAFAGVVVILHLVATGVRNTAQVHDLRQKCHRLREEQIAKLTEIAARSSFEPVNVPGATIKKAA